MILYDPESGASIEDQAAMVVSVLPSEMSAYVSSAPVSSLEPYPGYNVTGDTKDMGVTGYAGSESLRAVTMLNGLPGGAGTVRIHEGYDCESTGNVMLSPITGEDPWGEAFLSGNESFARINQEAESLPLSTVVGRTLVVYTADNAKIACGIVGEASAGEECAFLSSNQCTMPGE